jgi:predicted nucleic-acid-binding Zn-ribbon protein
MLKPNYSCPKCQCQNYSAEKVAMTGDLLDRLLNWQRKKFISVSCVSCGYTEFYKAKTGKLENITDFLIGG